MCISGSPNIIHLRVITDEVASRLHSVRWSDGRMGQIAAILALGEPGPSTPMPMSSPNNGARNNAGRSVMDRSNQSLVGR